MKEQNISQIKKLIDRYRGKEENAQEDRAREAMRLIHGDYGNGVWIYVLFIMQLVMVFENGVWEWMRE